MALTCHPERLPRAPTLHRGARIILIILILIIRVASRRSEFWSSFYRIIFHLSRLGVFRHDVVLNQKTILLLEFREAAEEALGGAELSARFAQVLQALADLETVAAVAVADFEPCRALVEFLAKAGAIFFIVFLGLGACDDMAVIDLGAEFLNICYDGSRAVTDAEGGCVAAGPDALDTFRPLGE